MISFEKLKRYNQALNAIIGTLIVAMVLGIGLKITVDYIKVVLRPQNQKIIVAPNPSEPAKRYSKIRLEPPRLVDETLRLFVIPVSQNKLKRPVQLESEALLASSRHYSSHLNNMVIYHHRTQEKDIMLKDRTLITRYAYKKSNQSSYIVFIGTQDDSNQNNQLDERDKLSFFYYNIQSKTLNELRLEHSVQSFQLHEVLRDGQTNTRGLYPNEILIESKSKKGGSVYHILNLETGNHRPLLAPETLNELQKILDLGA